METAKEAIKKTVQEYKSLFGYEFEVFKNAMRTERDRHTTKTGATFGTDTLDRKIAEWPETLETMFNMKLSKDEQSWFRSKEGVRWFVKNYNDFSAVHKI